MLQASAAPWVWEHADFGIQLDSLRLVVNDQATLLTGAERERGLRRFLAYPMYQSYRTRTDRELRVFALSRR